MYSNNREKFYQAALKRMVDKALEEKHQAFAVLHGDDTDEELAHYIRTCAKQLHHVPHEGEIYGSPMILERFGSWERAVRLAGLMPNPSKPKRSQFQIVQQETAYQQLHYRENRDKIKKAKAENRANKKH